MTAPLSLAQIRSNAVDAALSAAGGPEGDPELRLGAEAVTDAVLGEVAPCLADLIEGAEGRGRSQIHRVKVARLARSLRELGEQARARRFGGGRG